MIHGPVRFAASDIGDFLVTRPDGTALYDFACAVDDGEMSVTLVIRGDDHLSNTPRQLMLFDAFGAVAPRYAHAPLVAGADHRPLSKSRGSESVVSLRELGYLSSALVNHLALRILGPAGREVLTMDELSETFDVRRTSPSAPVHDPARLRWLNKRHMALLPPEDRIALVEAHAPALPPREALPAVRAALTGRVHGLPVATLLAFLGTAEAASRLELALRA